MHVRVAQVKSQKLLHSLYSLPFSHCLSTHGSMLHCSNSTPGPGHFWPLHDGDGESHVLDLLRIPELHSAEQFDQSPHVDHVPSTGQHSVLQKSVSSNVSVHVAFVDSKLLVLVFSPVPHGLVHSVHSDHSVTLHW